VLDGKWLLHRKVRRPRVFRKLCNSQGAAGTHIMLKISLGKEWVGSVENAPKQTSGETVPQLLGFRRLASPVNDRFAFQRSTRASFRFFPRGFRACPHLLDTVEEQIAAVFLVKRHRIVVT
jgi:hypothetical protein